MPLDIFTQRHLQDRYIKTITKPYKYRKIYTSRDDYIRDENGDYDYWMLNPVWRVTPCIEFVEGIGPLIMTCCNYNNGYNKDFLHLPRLPHHILPSPNLEPPLNLVVIPKPFGDTVNPLFSTMRESS